MTPTPEERASDVLTPPGFWVALCPAPCGWHEHADDQGTVEAKAGKHQLWHAWRSGKVPIVEETIDGRKRKKLAWGREQCVEQDAAPVIILTTLTGPHTAVLSRPPGANNLCALCLKKDAQAGLDAFKGA